MVVISNLGKVSYIIKNEEYNTKKAITYLNSLKKKHKKSIIDKGWHDAAIDLVKEFLKNCKKYGIEYKKKQEVLMKYYRLGESEELIKEAFGIEKSDKKKSLTAKKNGK